MSLDISCPDCGKLYTAEPKMVGKRIRCRQCTQTFLVQPAGGASSSSTAGGEVSPAASGSFVGRAPQVAAPVASRPQAARTPAAARPATLSLVSHADPNAIRKSQPQPFPASLALEAWIPLALCVVAAVWIPTETFADNHSGAGWAPVVRILAFALVYFALVVPATTVAAKKTLKRLRLAMPPSPFYRTLATFILPATLAYIFSMLSGGTGFVIGSVVGLAAVAIVFWLLFRLEPQETANAYAIVGGTYFGASVVGVLLLVLAATILNRMMVASNSASELHENPLGPEFAWAVPAAPPTPAHDHEVAPVSPSISGPDQSVPTEATPTPFVTQPTPPVHPDVALTGNGNMPSPDVPKSNEDNDADPTLQNGLFGMSGAVDGDPFVKGIQDAKLAWVKWIYRPSDQGIYEQSLSPLASSPIVALFRLPGIGGRTIECCRLTPVYRGLGALPLGDEGLDATATSGRYAITEDGTALLRLNNSAPPKVEVLPFRAPGTSVTLSVPAEFAKSSDALPATAELLGALPGGRFLVRWTSADQSSLQVYDYRSSTSKPPLGMKLGQSDWPNVFCVSPDGNLFAIAEREAEGSYIVVRSTSNAATPPMLFATADEADKTRRDCTGIAFSPNGSKIAVLMEHGTDGWIRSWQLSGESHLADGACKVPSADEMLGQLKGRSFDWVTEGKWLVHGRAMLDAETGETFGALTDQVVTAQQMADDHTAYLSYLGTDGHPHIAVVKFNPATLNAGNAKNKPK
jgi:ribosomal protein S27E